ncbi:MAG: hypothetical protein EU536_02945 [Promethearchaeota archaeon]|nr:MAG: hypothetical protein EU536_02945 [Candidatus Lokiarchaeota archaeon]
MVFLQGDGDSTQLHRALCLEERKSPLKKNRTFEEGTLEYLLQFSPTMLHDLAFRLMRENTRKTI